MKKQAYASRVLPHGNKVSRPPRSGDWVSVALSYVRTDTNSRQNPRRRVSRTALRRFYN